MQLRQVSQRGDTIVEVLIAIAVIGATLSGAYVLVNSSTRNNQAAQERSVAVKTAESQLELLRSYVTTTGSLPTGSFCLYENASTPSTVVKTDITSPLPATTNTGYPLQCLMDDGLATDRFVAGIESGAGNADLRSYTIYVTWDSPTGDRAQASIAYKVARP